MALDPNKLSRNELIQLLNSTALGEAITRSRLDRQMNRAGRRLVRVLLGLLAKKN